MKNKLVLLLILLTGIFSYSVAMASANEPPVAKIKQDTYIADEGTPIVFDASDSYDPDGDKLSYCWDFEDDGIWTTWSESSQEQYYYGDDYVGLVKLKVSDGLLTSIDTADVTIHNVPPTVNAGPDQLEYVGYEVYFEGSFSDPGWKDTHSITWDFGDGETETGKLKLAHVYKTPKLFTVTLTVIDDDGGEGSDTAEIRVLHIPIYHANLESCDKDGNLKDKFSYLPPESVFIIGSDFPWDTDIPIYVVKNVKMWFNTTNIKSLEVVSSILVTTDFKGNIPVTKIWEEKKIVPGYYDIVADVNANDIFDVAFDTVDDMDVDKSGFFVIPELTFGTIMGLLTCLMALGVFVHKQSNPRI